MLTLNFFNPFKRRCYVCKTYKPKTDFRSTDFFRCKTCREDVEKSELLISKLEEQLHQGQIGICDFCKKPIFGDTRRPDFSLERPLGSDGPMFHRMVCDDTWSKERLELWKLRAGRERIDYLCDLAWEKNRG